jgi:hypothetical protein
MQGLLIPLSDYARQGAGGGLEGVGMHQPQLRFSLRIDRGEVTYGKPVEPKR